MAVRHMGFELVPAKDIDPVETAALINAAFAVYPQRSGDRTSPSGLLEEASPSAQFLQAREDGRLAATSLLMPASGLSPDRFGGIDLDRALYFGLAAVEPALMGRGYGRAMLAGAERVTTDRGLDFLVLGTVRELGLVPYYERCGYAVVDHADFEAGHWQMTVPHRYCQMAKRVAAGLHTAVSRESVIERSPG